MITKAFYTERPDSIKYMLLPSGEADLWLRKDITEKTDSETGAVGYEADEAYMRTSATQEDVAADFETWFETAAAWRVPQPKKPPTQEERIAALEAENAELKEKLSITMDAVDFILLGVDEEV